MHGGCAAKMSSRVEGFAWEVVALCALLGHWEGQGHCQNRHHRGRGVVASILGTFLNKRVEGNGQ